MASMAPGVPVNARLKPSRRGMQLGKVEDDDYEGPTLKTQDNVQTRPPIYIYNICDLSHVRNQPPEFPAFTV